MYSVIAEYKAPAHPDRDLHIIAVAGAAPVASLETAGQRGLVWSCSRTTVWRVGTRLRRHAGEMGYRLRVVSTVGDTTASI